jgi:hypothetical protein
VKEGRGGNCKIVPYIGLLEAYTFSECFYNFPS